MFRRNAKPHEPCTPELPNFPNQEVSRTNILPLHLSIQVGFLHINEHQLPPLSFAFAIKERLLGAHAEQQFLCLPWRHGCKQRFLSIRFEIVRDKPGPHDGVGRRTLLHASSFGAHGRSSRPCPALVLRVQHLAGSLVAHLLLEIVKPVALIGVVILLFTSNYPTTVPRLLRLPSCA